MKSAEIQGLPSVGPMSHAQKVQPSQAARASGAEIQQVRACEPPFESRHAAAINHLCTLWLAVSVHEPDQAAAAEARILTRLASLGPQASSDKALLALTPGAMQWLVDHPDAEPSGFGELVTSLFPAAWRERPALVTAMTMRAMLLKQAGHPSNLFHIDCGVPAMLAQLTPQSACQVLSDVNAQLFDRMHGAGELPWDRLLVALTGRSLHTTAVPAFHDCVMRIETLVKQANWTGSWRAGLLLFMAHQLPDGEAQAAWMKEHAGEQLLMGALDPLSRLNWMQRKLNPSLATEARRMLGCDPGVPIDAHVPDSWLLPALVPELSQGQWDDVCDALKAQLSGRQGDIRTLAGYFRDRLDQGGKPRNLVKRFQGVIKDSRGREGFLLAPTVDGTEAAPGTRGEVAMAMLHCLTSGLALLGSSHAVGGSIDGVRNRLGEGGLPAWERNKLVRMLEQHQIAEQLIVQRQHDAARQNELLSDFLVQVTDAMAGRDAQAMAGYRRDHASALREEFALRVQAAQSARLDVPEAVSSARFARPIQQAVAQTHRTQALLGHAKDSGGNVQASMFAETERHAAPVAGAAMPEPHRFDAERWTDWLPDPTAVMEHLRRQVAQMSPGAALLPGASANVIANVSLPVPVVPVPTSARSNSTVLPATSVAMNATSPVAGKSPTQLMAPAGSELLMNREVAEHTRWSDWAAQEAETYFGALEYAERQEYVALARAAPSPDWLAAQVDEQAASLSAALGITTLDGYWVHTDVPASAKPSEGRPANKQGRGPSIGSDGQYVPLHNPDVNSVSLRDYLAHGVDRTVLLGGGSAEAFIAHTRINRDPSGDNRNPGLLDVRKALATIRRLDPGAALERWVEAHVGEAPRQSGAGLWPELRNRARQQVQFDLLDARRANVTSDAEHVLLRHLLLDDSVTDHGSLEWSPLEMRLGGMALALPGMWWDVTNRAGQSTRFSYWPGRPGGALRRYLPDQGATDDLVEQINTDLRAQSGRASWLLKGLSRSQQMEIYAAITPVKVNERALSALGKTLYQWLVAHQSSQQIQLAEGHRVRRAVGVPEALATQEANRIRADARGAMASNGRADWERAGQILSKMGNEALEYLMMAVPGEVRFPGRNALFQLAIGWKLLQLPDNLAHKRWLEVAQSASDFVDMAVGIKASRMAGQLAAKRSMPANLRIDVAPDGKLVAWSIDDLVKYSEPGFPAGGVEGPDGVWRNGEDTRVRVATSGGTCVIRVAKHGTSWQLVHGDLGGARPVVGRGDDGLWRLQLDDHLDLTAPQLLRRMASDPQLRELTDEGLQQVLDAAGASLESLRAVWNGWAQPSVALVQAAMSRQHRSLVRSLGSRLAGADSIRLSPQVEQLVLAQLSTLATCDLRIHDRRGFELGRYLPSGHGDDGLPVIKLLRDDSWRYRPFSESKRADVEPEHSLFHALVKAREEQSATRSPGGLPGSVVSQRARTLKTRCAEWFAGRANEDGILRALTHDRRLRPHVGYREGSLLPMQGGRGSIDYPAWRVQVRRHYPDFSEAQIDEAGRRFPSLKTVDVTGALPTRARSWMEAVDTERRLANARMAIASSGGGAFTRDAEALFLHALLALPGFPATTSVTVREGREGPVQTWGPDDATDVITLMRSETTGSYATYVGRRDDSSVFPMREEHALASVVLQCLPDDARRSIGVDINDAQGLQDKVLQVAKATADLQAARGRSLPGGALLRDELAIMRSELVDYADEETGLHRSDDDKTYLVHQGRTYRVLGPTITNSVPTWYIVDEQCRAAQEGNDFDPVGVGTFVPVRQAHGQWRRMDVSPEASPTVSSRLAALAITDLSTLDTLWRQSVRDPEAKTFSVGAHSYIRMTQGDGREFFLRIAPTASDGAYEVYQPQPSALHRGSGVFVGWGDTHWWEVDEAGLSGGSRLSQMFAKRYRDARRALKDLAQLPQTIDAMTDTQKVADGDTLAQLMRQSNAGNPGMHVITDYVNTDQHTINRTLRKGQTSDASNQFLEKLLQLNQYHGVAYRAIYVTASGAAALRAGVGTTFRDLGVQSASILYQNAIKWLETWSTKTEPTKTEPAKSEPAKSEPAKSEPTNSEPTNSEPTNSEPEPAKQKVVLVFDQTVPKKNLSNDQLKDHVAVLPGTPIKVLAIREGEGVLFVYMGMPSVIPDHVYSIHTGRQVI